MDRPVGVYDDLERRVIFAFVIDLLAALLDTVGPAQPNRFSKLLKDEASS